jgi:hypothetical protein
MAKEQSVCPVEKLCVLFKSFSPVQKFLPSTKVSALYKSFRPVQKFPPSSKGSAQFKSCLQVIRHVATEVVVAHL